MLAQKSQTSRNKSSAFESRTVWPPRKIPTSQRNYLSSAYSWDRPFKEHFVDAQESRNWHTEKDWPGNRLEPPYGLNTKLTRKKESSKDKFLGLKEALALAKGALLSLKEDWDGEGSPGYSPKTWQRMSSFLEAHCAHLVKTCGISTPIPQILPGPSGSIDLLWKAESFELLLNVPADSTVPASFYGDDRGSISIKGKLDTSKINQGFLQWLMSHQTP